MLATVSGYCLDRIGNGYVLVLRVPRCIGRIAPDTPKITIARPEKYRRRPNEFALALNCVEKLTEFHI